MKHWCCNENMKDFALFFLRLVVGIIFVYAGWGKLSNMEMTIGAFGSMGFPAPAFFAYLVGLVEFLGGIALIVGFFTRLAAGLLSIVMIVALLAVHTKMPFMQAQLPLVLLGATVALKYLGPGAWKVWGMDCVCKMKEKK